MARTLSVPRCAQASWRIPDRRRRRRACGRRSRARRRGGGCRSCRPRTCRRRPRRTGCCSRDRAAAAPEPVHPVTRSSTGPPRSSSIAGAPASARRRAANSPAGPAPTTIGRRVHAARDDRHHARARTSSRAVQGRTPGARASDSPTQVHPVQLPRQAGAGARGRPATSRTSSASSDRCARRTPRWAATAAAASSLDRHVRTDESPPPASTPPCSSFGTGLTGASPFPTRCAMALRIAINGFGRIGRCILRIGARRPRASRSSTSTISSRPTPARPPAHARLGARHLVGPIEVRRRRHLDRRQAGPQVTAEKDPAKLPWKDERSTSCSSAPASSPSARRPRPTSTPAPAGSSSPPPPTDEDITVVLGVNDDKLRRREAHHHLATPRAPRTASPRWRRSLHDAVGIERGLMTTIHSLHDGPEPARRPPQEGRPPPRPRRGAQHGPDLHRRRQGDRPRACPSSRASSTAWPSASPRRTSPSSTSRSSPSEPTTKDESTPR